MEISGFEDIGEKKKRMDSLYSFISYIIWEGDKHDKHILKKLNKELCGLEALFYLPEDTISPDLILNA